MTEKEIIKNTKEFIKNTDCEIKDVCKFLHKYADYVTGRKIDIDTKIFVRFSKFLYENK